MRPRSRLERIFAACVLALALASCGSRASDLVLFIGNSFTYVNGGINAQLEGLAPSSKTSLVAPGGATLQGHWNDANTRAAIRSHRWAYVVLQEQSQTPVFDQARFSAGAKELDREIRRGGAKTVLLMTWERPDSVKYGVTTANLAAAYNAAGAELGAKVAPAGLAFARALRERPDLVLYSQDGHPTAYGTYLAACVLYATIYGRSPVGNAYADKSMPPQLRDFFQRIAAEVSGY